MFNPVLFSTFINDANKKAAAVFTVRANFGGAVNRSVRIGEAQMKAENSKVGKKKCLTQQRGKNQIYFDKIKPPKL